MIVRSQACAMMKTKAEALAFVVEQRLARDPHRYHAAALSLKRGVEAKIVVYCCMQIESRHVYYKKALHLQINMRLDRTVNMNAADCSCSS